MIFNTSRVGFFSGVSALPSGAIIGFDGAIAPAGFDDFASADGYSIRGASSYAEVGDVTSGTSSASVTLNTSGSHTGTHFPQNPLHGVNVDAGEPSACACSSAGSHYHSGTLEYITSKNSVRLIKAARKVTIPIGSLVFSSGSDLVGGVEAFDTFNGSGGLLTAGNVSNASVVAAIPSVNVASKSFSHRHKTGIGCTGTQKGSDQSNYNGGYAGPSHTHTITPSVTDNIQRARLRAWKAISDITASESNMIIMWEDEALPAGWTLCDGTDGTPDLRGECIGCDATGDGTTVGNDTINYSGTSSSNGSHEHRNGVNGVDDSWCWECHSNNVSHTHVTSASNVSWLPASYKLMFLMRK